MANCPKCGVHLRLIDWKQHCPKCGANIFVYDLQERLMQQADVAEVQNYHFQKKLDRLKASFVGNKLAITRIFTSLLPIGALFLPLVNITAKEPLQDLSGKISVLEIYKQIENLSGDTLNIIFKNSGSVLLPISIICLLLTIVGILIHFLLLTLANSPKGKLRGYITDGLLIAFTFIAPISFLCLPEDTVITGTLGIGTYLLLGLQLANVIIDILTLKKGMEIKHKPCFVGGIPIDEYFEMVNKGTPQADIRAEQYRRLQILHDEKERAIKEQAEKEAKTHV